MIESALHCSVLHAAGDDVVRRVDAVGRARYRDKPQARYPVLGEQSREFDVVRRRLPLPSV